MKRISEKDKTYKSIKINKTKKIENCKKAQKY